MKNIFKTQILIATAIASLTFTGCKKDDNTNDDDLMQPNAMLIELNHKVGSATLAFGTNYINANGDTFQINKFNYYLSNFKFKKTDGTWVSAEQNRDSGLGYFLVEESTASSKDLSMANIPAGDYTEVQFLIGVDSAANNGGSQGGALDPANNMFWTWSSGYIYAKLEGASPQSPSGNITFHTGGKSPDNSRIVTLVLPESATVRKNISPEIHMFVNAAEWFKTPNTIDFSMTNNVMSGHDVTSIVDNYSDMFSIDHVHNDAE